MLIAGVDEVGRGPLVGDVVTAAVILILHVPLPLSMIQKNFPKKNEKLYIR